MPWVGIWSFGCDLPLPNFNQPLFGRVHMKYSLRSLIIVMLVAPPLLAMIFFSFSVHHSVTLAVVLIGLGIGLWLERRRHGTAP